MQSVIRLLLVEDDDIQVVLFRELVKRLDDMSIDVTDVPTLNEGKKQLDDHDFDLIVTDLWLPDSTSMQTLDGLMAHADGVPVVVLSGESDATLTPETLARGAQGFLSKHNVTGTELRRVVQQSILRKQYVDQVINGMSKDPLTGVWDRAAFSKLLREAQKSDSRYAVIFFDVNDFKTINDTYGHSKGDEALVGVVTRMRKAIRDDDAIGRWGGDEFAVLACGIENSDELRDLCIRTNKATNGTLAVQDGGKVAVTVSCGAALAEIHQEPQAVIDAADRAMYAAKKEGLSLPHFAEDHLDSAGHNASAQPAGSATANVLSDAEFWYQPMLNVETGKVWGYEALARWSGSGQSTTELNLRRLLNSTFAPEFAAHTIEMTCQALAEDLDDTDSLLISFNLHAAQFANPLVVSSGLEAVLATAPISATQLQIELTDAIQLMPQTDAVEMLWRLNEMGVRIAIDDFCDDHSSFDILLKLPVDAIKIDRAITAQLLENHMAARIVRGLVHLCDGSIDLIAEGVESEAQSQQLQELGVVLQQGFLHGRPTKILPSATPLGD